MHKLTAELIANEINALKPGASFDFEPFNSPDFSRVFGCIEMYIEMRLWHFEYMRFNVIMKQNTIHVERMPDVHKP